MKYIYLAFAALLQLSVSGCISDPKHVEDDFGTSVKQMVAAQIYDPAAASRPDLIPPLILDGEVAGAGVDGYREGAKKGEDRSTSKITFSVN